jgi:glutamate/tyrosine decarboxylase-like PLP-dependent enzyme
MSNMIETLTRLETAARALEPDSQQRENWLGQAGRYTEQFLDGLPESPVYRHDDGAGCNFEPGISDAPAGMAELLAVLGERIDAPGINPASGGHLGYIPGGGVYPSALGDYLADVTNRYSGVSFASPGAARMESGLVRWMADLVGYPDTAGGDLTSGGSTANLSAIVAAREALEISARQVPDCCIYLTRQTHHCVDKALRVAGMGEARLRYVPMDRLYRMNATELAGLVQADLDHGLKPFLVVASAGTTDTGAVDPLVEIGAVAGAFGLWMHLDAAYGGFFMLCEEGREVLEGIGCANSMVMDPHKGLFLPYGSGAVLVRDVDTLARAHRYEADYMQDAHQPGQDYSPAELSVELSRPFRGLRLWLPLRLFGLAPFRAALAEKIWLARYFHECMSELEGWEVGPPPDLSVVTYRYLPASGDADEFNRRLLQAVHDDSRVFITSTLLNGRYTLRLAVLHFRTHREHVDYLIDLLQATVKKLSE